MPMPRIETETGRGPRPIPGSHTARVSAARRGASLIVVLLMLIVIALLGASASRLAVQGQKASRSVLDRQVAWQAAEAALADAELDIRNSPDSARSRSAIFSRDSLQGFEQGCGAGADNRYAGLCLRAPDGMPPVWLTVDFLDNGAATARSVAYGRFTGKRFKARDAGDGAPADGPVPARLPRYIIEALVYNKPGEGADQESRTYFYRITAIGFGLQAATRVVLQELYRKEE